MANRAGTLLLLAAAAVSAASSSTGSAYVTVGVNGALSCRFVAGVVDKAATAWGSYTPMLASPTGFGSLTVKTSAASSAAQQTFGAGCVEGALTSDAIWQHHANMESWLIRQFPDSGGVIPAIYQQFFESQDSYARANAASNSSQPWAALGLVLAQFDGLAAGYAATAPPSNALSTWSLQQLSAIGDFLDLIPALQPHSEAARPWRWWDNQTVGEVLSNIAARSHCSGLIKMTANFSDVFFGHSAWFTFVSTHRLYKHYDFALTDAAYVGRRVSFSSYPGALSSIDDFLTVWSSGLVVIETTNSVLNASLWDLITPQSLWAWQRVRVASLLAVDGMSWGALLAWQNSGTYNNAYSILRTTGWTAGSPLTDGTLVLAEQIPGKVVYGDVSQTLAGAGFFAMFNVPYWREIYDASGYPQVVAHFTQAGVPLAQQAISGLDWQLAPRAQIFRARQGSVVDMPSFTALMRYNDFKNDPLSQGSPWNAICSRGDLSSSPSPDGCYDTKASSASLWSSAAAMVVNGPTVGDGDLPAFAWSEFASSNYTIQGLPAVYDFQLGAEAPASL